VEASKNVRIAWLGLALIVAGTIPALWAVGQLSDGLAEVPHHWWSTVAIVPIALGILTTAAGLFGLSRSSPRS
jgi:hypothetical protein